MLYQLSYFRDCDAKVVSFFSCTSVSASLFSRAAGIRLCRIGRKGGTKQSPKSIFLTFLNGSLGAENLRIYAPKSCKSRARSFSFWREKFLLPEPEPKKSRATFFSAPIRKIMARKPNPSRSAGLSSTVYS